MNWNKHLELAGSHAFLGASKYHWINYDEDKLINSYNNYISVEKGTLLHELAASCIRMNQKLPKNQKTMSMYVNDAIGFKMTPEQVLYYSENCYGTADCILFRDGVLRIHDLKTGSVPAHIEQLMIYAALFCLEYRVKPEEIETELRIYQNNEILYHKPAPEEIREIMNKIVAFDKIIRKLKEEER